MEVYIVESDRHYREALRKGLIQYMSKGDQITAIGPKEGYAKIKEHVEAVKKGQVTDSILWLVDESVIHEWVLEDGISQYVYSSGKCVLLSESVYGYHLAEFEQSEEKVLCRIDKFQPADDIYGQLKRYYLDNMGLRRIESQDKETTIQIHFSPIWTNKVVEKYAKITNEGSVRRLLVLMDGYSYRQSVSENLRKFHMGLSEVFYYFHKQQEQLDWIVHEAAHKESSSLDIIYGPKHMQDFEFLSKDEMKQLIIYMKQAMTYDRIDIVMNGLMITSRINSILNAADECILYVENERIQQTILEQTTCTWHVCEKE